MQTAFQPSAMIARLLEGVAFLNASLAGVFVAASAGNTGIVSGAISNAAPWVTTVGAAVTKFVSAGRNLPRTAG